MRDVFIELECRATSANVAYPFCVDGHVLRRVGSVHSHVPYLLCLLMSYCREDSSIDLGVGPRLFEDVCTHAAREFVDGDAVRFGSPRDNDEIPRGFREAIEDVIRRLGEGTRFRETDEWNQKDDRVDIIAWRHFPDAAAGKLVLFGNCATTGDMGDIYGAKCSEMNPEAFCKKWFSAPFWSPILRAYFVPHRLATSGPVWEHLVADSCSLVFERCRTAFYAQQAEGHDWGPQMDWIEEQLQNVLA